MSAIVFDCDGVLADTERDGHLPAFNQMFAEYGLPVQWSEVDYAEKVLIGGGKERMASLLTPEFVAQAGLPTDPEEQRQQVAAWHKRKTAIYKEMVQSGKMPPRPGIKRITAEAIEAGWTLVVASTSAEESVRSVLEFVVGKEMAQHFKVYAGDMVPRKKPAPDIYLLAKEELNLSPESTLVIEDSRNGMLAAVSAGFRCLVTVSSYTQQEDFHEAIMVVSSLGDLGVPTQVLKNRSAAQPGEYLTLRDIEACLKT
ncbi:HAD-IA family hydrolase [Leptolyngbya ohadii]|uniref:HAD-IA family hydrolase n=1 Tax=Leptolyngbya ohadii TaxID=1962290 RepID=UPI000B59C9CA|nr:HAD-IA family hydrolase [Leptolyngbya ohadii]